MKQYIGQCYLIAAASIWGGLYVISKIVMDVLNPMELVWVRYLIAVIILIIMGKIMKESWHVQWKDVPLIIFIGLCGYVVSIWAQFAGTQLSSAQTGSVITSSSPAFMVIFSKLILHEKITFRKGASVLMATVGVLFIVGLGQVNQNFQLGSLILVLAAMTWAIISVLIKKIPEEYSILAVTTYAMLAALLIITPAEISIWNNTIIYTILEPKILAGILYIGVISTAGAFYLWNKGIQMVDASTGGIYLFFQPLTGTFLGGLFLGEQIGIPFIFGSVLIFISIILVVKK
ncbi:DMT family transporter [Megasphaera paucivorans]|uniref:Permease of the drug/metabolite transporter (DMT) superfamily n=1 Tax=Megasphaera paucivorans TaxID=349095 RepID=A0A1G9YUM5_9FIRM|nr:DMT family transporter [Megasphaera paucivorans]SDN12784.1 Permease of the drug/metabolite transporter (DMT) superfamily [Megasphaera paucivorans]